MDAEENVADDTAADAPVNTHRAHPEDVESLGDAHQGTRGRERHDAHQFEILSSTGQVRTVRCGSGRSPRVERDQSPRDSVGLAEGCDLDRSAPSPSTGHDGCACLENGTSSAWERPSECLALSVAPLELLRRRASGGVHHVALRSRTGESRS